MTIEYTALSSVEYRQELIQALDPELTIDRPFSFRQQFPTAGERLISEYTFDHSAAQG